MERAGRVVVLLAVLGAAVWAGDSTVDSLNPNRLPRTSELALRLLATSAPRPAYPELSAMRGSSGVAVVWVEVGSDGTPSLVRALQAPDDMIGKSTVLAVRRWRFRTSGVPPRYCGKITYYFLKSGNRIEVIGGDE
jgi:TonB family protein